MNERTYDDDDRPVDKIRVSLISCFNLRKPCSSLHSGEVLLLAAQRRAHSTSHRRHHSEAQTAFKNHRPAVRSGRTAKNNNGGDRAGSRGPPKSRPTSGFLQRSCPSISDAGLFPSLYA
ncbi:hypothetical protein HPB47_003449 [Ixodes persulcatus]|uniref:Uncharacterized protein n=1 Tax=Ixodes persulcatus TaxID=34615 RepID=A0AC60PJH1_IXOPE|nr:hypothetical protein HPB47_003449 [Ixodes persulcatus]